MAHATSVLLGKNLSLDNCDIATDSYCYFNRNGNALYYWPISGYIEWESVDYNVGFISNFVPGQSATEADAMEKQALAFLTSTNLIALQQDEEIFLDGSYRNILESNNIRELYI